MGEIRQSLWSPCLEGEKTTLQFVPLIYLLDLNTSASYIGHTDTRRHPYPPPVQYTGGLLSLDLCMTQWSSDKVSFMCQFLISDSRLSQRLVCLCAFALWRLHGVYVRQQVIFASPKCRRMSFFIASKCSSNLRLTFSRLS